MTETSALDDLDHSYNDSLQSADQLHEVLARSPAPSYSNCHLPLPTLPNPPASPTPRGRPANILNRISFGRSKGIKDLALQDLEKRRRAEKEEMKAQKDVESRERKARRDQEDKQRNQRRRLSKERAKKNREEKQERQREEKRVKDLYGIRGFDPNAGMLRATRKVVPRPEAEGRAPASERNQVSPTPRHRTGQVWGIDFGKPNHHDGKGHFSGIHENCGERYGGRNAAFRPGGKG